MKESTKFMLVFAGVLSALLGAALLAGKAYGQQAPNAFAFVVPEQAKPHYKSGLEAGILKTGDCENDKVYAVIEKLLEVSPGMKPYLSREALMPAEVVIKGKEMGACWSTDQQVALIIFESCDGEGTNCAALVPMTALVPMRIEEKGKAI